MNCKDCGEPMFHHKCDQCYGTKFVWARDETGDVPIDCPTCDGCDGCGEEFHCGNTDCPGIVWYILSRTDSATLRMVIESITREEKQ